MSHLLRRSRPARHDLGRFGLGFGMGLGALLVLLAPRAQATTVGPLQSLDTSPAMAAQRAPAVSWDGTRYVVVWEDSRTAAAGLELFLARIAPTGMITDANGLPVLTPGQPSDQTQPSISWNGAAGHHMLAWTDARSGSSEIYAARFFPDNAGLFPEPGGTPLTNTAAASEARPAVACATQSCLVAFQQSQAGVIDLRGVRVYPSGDLQDQAPFDLVANTTGRSLEGPPAVTATTASFIVAWEDDRNRTTGVLGADLFGRTLSDLGTVTAVPGTLLTSANYRQSAPSLASLTGSQIIAVWQDQRSGTSSTAANEDVWRGRYGLTLTPAGAAAALTVQPGAQLSPKVAAGGGRGLVVWQDFRNGAFGLTYASRIDATGASLDGGGFPVIAQNANMIEHAVAKGPGNDYLVLSVRTTPAPARIFYRIVRDEPPAGTMTASGNATVPADGATPAQISFATARGASGFVVADGTLYTVTFSSPDVVIAAPDAAPNRPGHQIVAVDGQLPMALTSLRPGTVTVSVASVEGSSIGSTMVTFSNVPPTVTNVRITPEMPRSDQDLTVSYSYQDINSDPEGTTQIQWTRDSAIQPAFTNMRTVPASATSRGELWRVQVRAHDGRDFAAGFVFSANVLILNTAPLALDPRIEPGTGVKTGTELRARYTYRDPDMDPQTGSVLRWYERGVEQTALEGETTVPGALVRKGQAWSFSVIPSDGTDTGPLVRSATITVENTIPIAVAGPEGMPMVLERRDFTLDASASSDADPEDVLTYTWRQIDGPMVALSDPSAPNPSFTAPSASGSTFLRFGLVVSDGESMSPEDLIVVQVGLVPDQDNDGLDDEEEELAMTDPARADTDRDGANDGAEVMGGTNPLDEDTDDDGVRDGAEVRPFEDTDLDGLVNALDPDSDDDGILDGTELGETSPPMGTDQTAGNFVADADRSTTTDPINPDTDGDEIADGVEDANQDGAIQLGESDPNDPTSTVGCSPDRTCPAPFACVDDACRAVGMADGGQCLPLANRNLECCTGGCSGGTLATPICEAAGRSEQCPVGATQCSAGSCSSTTPPPNGGDEGCSCAVTASRDQSGASSLLIAAILGALITWGRRRR